MGMLYYHLFYMDKQSLSEADIRSKFITPSILQSGRKQEQIREEVSFTKGKIKVN
jgi:type I restriction enzyme R subunit